MRLETLKTIAIPHLLALKDKMSETFGLSVLDEKRKKNRIVFSIRGPDYTCFSFEENTLTPLHTSAPGKALVAHLPDAKRSALLGQLSFERLTPNTVTDRRVFERRLARIRRSGYATDIAEEVNCCHCGGVAILDPNGYPVGALWLSGVDRRLRDKQLRTQIRHLQSAAKLIEAEVAQWLRAEKQTGSFSPCVAMALAALSRQPQRTFDYAALAKDSHLSYSTLRTRFRAETGITLGQHHLNLRIKEVQRLLAQTTLSITEIAARMNFYDQKHLSAVFKKKVGLAPVAYRRQATAR